MAMDGIELEILWSNLVSAASEQARALQRIAFSPVVREAGDLACALLDREGRMIAQAVTGTPGHINTLAAAGAHFVEKFPTDSLTEGDILITNDPWLSAGHFFDITIITPVFRKGRVIAYFGSTIHHTDIGGYGVGAGARDVHEEGLWIPRAKLYEAGKPNEVLFDIIRHNVRTKDEVMGDIAAQVSSGKVGAERLQLLCDRHNLDDIDDLSAEIIKRSEAATRDSIRKLKGGTYHGESRFDIPGGAEILLKCAMTIDAEAGSVHIDFEGSSGASPHGVNVVLNYTHAYATFALRSTLDPDLPNNYGSLTPITVSAPEGCIVNAKYPSPVAARHVVGMYVPMPILKALRQVAPDDVLAEGAGAVWTFQVQGKDDAGDPFTSAMFNYSGGMGARRTKDGLGATCYPTGVAAVPVRGAGSRHADPVHPERTDRRLRRRGQVSRRRRTGHRLPPAHPGRMAAQRRPQPPEDRGGRLRRRRGRRGRALPDQRQGRRPGQQDGHETGRQGDPENAGWRGLRRRVLM